VLFTGRGGAVAGSRPGLDRAINRVLALASHPGTDLSYSLQAALLAAGVASAAFGARRLGVLVARWCATTTGETRAGRSGRTGFGRVDSQIAAPEFLTVKLFDCFRRSFVIGELDEGEASRSAGGAICR